MFGEGAYGSEKRASNSLEKELQKVPAVDKDVFKFCVFKCVCPGAHGSQQMALDLKELELQVVVHLLLRML